MDIIQTMIIVRSEYSKIQEVPKWGFIFGRRKTGKTFLAKNFLKYNSYFFIKNNKSITQDGQTKELSYETFIELIREKLSHNETIIIDEFHRLGENFLDFLHYTDKKGKIILISSTLYLSKNLLSSKSPILGLFAEFPIGLIKLEDIFSALKSQNLSKKEFVEFAILLREPITVDYVRPDIKVRDVISEAVILSAKSIPAMIGEIFTEEDRHISAVYEGILRAIANGNIISTEIASSLFSRELIPKDDPSYVQQYLKNLTEFGIIKKIQVFNKNKFVYKHISPLARLFYYADEKYNISERVLTKDEMKRIVDELMPRILEDNIREYLAEKLSLQESVCEGKDYDVDACLLKFKKVDTAVEIKWKDKIDSDEIERASKNLDIVKPRRKLLFVPDKSRIKNKVEGIEVVDISDFWKRD